MGYQAVICRLQSVRKHPGADRLQLAVCLGNQIVIGMDHAEGELGVFFPADGVLSDEFCKVNDLYPRLDAEGKRIGGGFIDPKNRRVRAQGFRGQKSYGFWLPISCLSYVLKGASMDEGVGFTDLGGKNICEKHVSRATEQAIARRKAKGARRETTMFKAHFETEFWWKSAKKLVKPGANIVVTEKLHGTSQRYGLTLEDAELPLWKRIVNRFLPIFPTRGWKYMIGTRNVVLGGVENAAHEPFRANVVKGITLHKGETLFFEVVGYDTNGKTIMPAPKIEDKAIAKQYGATHMTYSYGCAPGEAKMFVYRITQTNEDGVSFELPWDVVKARCNQLGLKHVPELVCGGFDGDGDALEVEREFNEVCEEVTLLEDGPSTVDARHLREGVCVRVDQGETVVFKAKSHAFQVLEGIAKEAPDTVDVEEAS